MGKAFVWEMALLEECCLQDHGIRSQNDVHTISNARIRGGAI